MRYPKKNHIVICGFSRSGTSLLYHMLFNSCNGYAFVDREVSALTIRTPDKNIVTKRPNDSFFLDKIFQKLSQDRNIKIIFQIRDPRDLICSIHEKVPHDFFIGYEYQYFVPQHLPPKKISYGIQSFMKVYDLYKDHPDVYISKYETILKTPEIYQTELNEKVFFGAINCHFPNISSESRLINRMAAPLNKLRRLDESRIGVWQKYPKRILDEFERYPELFDVVIKLGYETDSSWINVLRTD